MEPTEDELLPESDIIPDGWYFYNVHKKQGGFKGTSFEKLVATCLRGDYSARTLEISFAVVDHNTAARVISYICYNANMQ